MKETLNTRGIVFPYLFIIPFTYILSFLFVVVSNHTKQCTESVAHVQSLHVHCVSGLEQNLQWSFLSHTIRFYILTLSENKNMYFPKRF